MAYKKSAAKVSSTSAKMIRTMKTRIDGLKAELAQTRMDGWGNIFSGMGIPGVDRSMDTRFDDNDTLTEIACQSLYRSEGTAKRVIDLPVGDMLREGFVVVGDADGNVQDELKRLKINKGLTRSLTWADVYGGSLLVLGIDDGGTLEDELDISKMKKIEFIKVYDRHRVLIEEVYDDPEQENFGQPSMYNVTPLMPAGVTDVPDFNVHASRTLFWDGVDVPDFVRQNNEGWGDSKYQALETSVMHLGVSFEGVARIIDEFVLGTLEIKNLRNLIAGGREKEVRDRLRMVDMSKSMIRSVLVDKDENYDRKTATVSGLKDLLQEMEKFVCAHARIPQVLLFGEQSKGLGGEAAGSVRLYYDQIAADQKEKLQPNLERLIWLIQMQKEGPFKGKELDSWSIKFNPLWQPTEKEQAETRKTQAETDEIYYNMGAIEPEEITNSRFGNDEYSYETELMFERNEGDMAERKKNELEQRTQMVKNFKEAGKQKTEAESEEDEIQN